MNSKKHIFYALGLFLFLIGFIILDEACALPDNFYKKEKVTSVKAAKTESTDPKESYFEVIVNGDGVDLAYVYVLSGGKWLNAAMLLNIKVEGVSRLLPEDLQDEDAEINEEPIDDDLNNYNEPDELSIDEE